MYVNLYTPKHTAYKMNSLFCFKRLVYGFIAVFCSSYVVPNVYSYTIIALFSIGYNLNYRPMKSRVLNFIENVNEFIIYCCGYFLLIFTQWICDPMIRYKVGFLFIYAQILIVAINFLVIFFEIGYCFMKYLKRHLWW